MIHSVVPTLPTQLAALGDVLAQMDGNAAQSGDFGALLTQTAGAATRTKASTMLPGAAPSETDAITPTPIAAPTSGNMLPPALPETGATLPLTASLPVYSAASPGMQSAALDEQPETSVPSDPAETRARPRGTARAISASLVQRPVSEPAKPPQPGHGNRPVTDQAAPPAIEPTTIAPAPLLPQEPQPSSGAQSANTVSAATASSPVLPPRAIAAAPTQQATPPSPAAAPTESAAAAAHKAKPLPEPAPQALAHAAPHAVFLRAASVPVIAPQPGQPVTPADAAQQPVARIAAALRIEVALPIPAEPAAKAPDQAQTIARRTALLQPGSAPPMLAAPEAAPLHSATPPAIPALVTSPRPHDFTALVDRLVAAREAVQPPGAPMAALLTVAHAEFGPVELRFRHDERGLAVSLASADPDFARAAAAAPPVILPVGTAILVPTDNSQTAASRDTGFAAGGAATGQSRGQQSERRGDPAPQPSHGARGSADRSAGRRSGIFA